VSENNISGLFGYKTSNSGKECTNRGDITVNTTFTTHSSLKDKAQVFNIGGLAGRTHQVVAGTNYGTITLNSDTSGLLYKTNVQVGGCLGAGDGSEKNNINRGTININGKHKTEVRISAPAVHKLRASSSGDIILKNGLQTKGEVSMKSSSSGDIEGGNVVCDVLNAESSSSGDVSIKELKAETVNAAASSSGDVSIKYLKAESVNAEASSSGDVILSGVCRSANFRHRAVGM
jgi:hypothetical protein